MLRLVVARLLRIWFCTYVHVCCVLCVFVLAPAFANYVIAGDGRVTSARFDVAPGGATSAPSAAAKEGYKHKRTYQNRTKQDQTRADGTLNSVHVISTCLIHRVNMMGCPPFPLSICIPVVLVVTCYGIMVVLVVPTKILEMSMHDWT